LRVDPNERITFMEMYTHKWINKGEFLNEDDLIEHISLSPKKRKSNINRLNKLDYSQKNKISLYNKAHDDSSIRNIPNMTEDIEEHDK